MISMWIASLAIAAAGPEPDAAASDAEPLIITPSTIHDFDPGFVEPRPVVHRRTVPLREPSGALSEIDPVRRKYEAEIRRIEAIIARTEATVRSAHE